jgi:CCR4-NOT complex subunit CAF16
MAKRSNVVVGHLLVQPCSGVDWKANVGSFSAMVAADDEEAVIQTSNGEVMAMEAKGLTYFYDDRRGGAANTKHMEPKLIDVNCEFPRGSRVLIAGSNGAGKSTLLSILGGKKMSNPQQCKVLGRPAFHDSTLNGERMYCGEWWRTEMSWNVTCAELMGEKRLKTKRVQELIDIMQVNVSWRINGISDGQRRRCQILRTMADERSIYVLDEITSDLDMVAREGLLKFLRRETEERGATVFYATHIFDHLADWATHVLYFSEGRVARCSTMEDLSEYHELVAEGARCPLYALMKRWVLNDYKVPVMPMAIEDVPVASDPLCPTIETRNLTFAYAGGAPQLKNNSFAFSRGARILVVGANGAGKSTLLSVLGGRRMLPRGQAFVLGHDCFHDRPAAQRVIYCGDWWRTQFFMNIKIGDLLGQDRDTARVHHLAEVLQVNLDWKINECSDGMRRRCQLLKILATPREVYLMDEITHDLDIFAREGILAFLRAESEIRGATIFYCTHIFDHLEGWASHMLHLSQGEVVRACPFSEVHEYDELVAEGNLTPLYSLVQRWVYAECEVNVEDAKPWRRLHDTSDGRLPNLGLAGPLQL